MNDDPVRDADAGEADAAPAKDEARGAEKKPYQRPSISRHGNLRLMTQLE